ncbi:MAG: arginine--tRNA ligase [Alistipes sp.]|nr:arginine--tRNA ligase [Alistipes sp.]
MKKFLECISQICEEAFTECGYDAKYARVTVSNRPDLCEYQCNGAMAAAKEYKKAPIIIAGEVVEKLKGSAAFSKIEAVNPGFINITLTGSFAAEYINDMFHDKDLGYDKVEKPQTIVMDYGGANVAKPLHIGHLRAAIIGESVKRIMRNAGNTVIGDIHMGDWGLQMGLIIEQLRDTKPELVYFDENYDGEYPKEAPFTLSELAELYPAASARSKEDERFMERAHLATVKVQNGDKACMALWEHIMNVSLPDLKKNYDNLNVYFDVWKGESDAKPYIPDMVQDLVDRGFAHESQGALVVDVAEETDAKEIPPCIIRKSDGAALYATSDLATIVQREADYAPDRYIYITDRRQEMHFTQVFRVAKKAGIVSEKAELTHMGYGTMNGRDGKPFKTRTGGVMRLEQLISEVNEAVYNKIMENRSVSEEDAKETARVVGLAAVKYGDLSNQASKDYVFDIDRFASFEGNTGPYILYTIVRIKSILRNFAEQGGSLAEDAMNIKEPVNASEKALMLELSKYNEMLAQAYEEIAPHKICQYIYGLSDAFNSFYHETRILAEEDEEKKNGYIALLVLTRKVLEKCIDLLGFEAPDRM